MSQNTFYPEVEELWKPVIKRMFLPFLTLEDFFMSQITSISFPSISTGNVSQSNQMYELKKRGGKQLDHTMSKSFTLTIKLSESYMTYFMARQQFELFLKFGENAKNLYFPPVSVCILDDGGFEAVTYTYYQLTPSSLSDFDLSFQPRAGSFSTFTWTFDYNYFDIYYRDPDTKVSRHMIDKDNGMLRDKPINLGALSDNQLEGIISRDANNERFARMNALNTMTRR